MFKKERSYTTGDYHTHRDNIRNNIYETRWSFLNEQYNNIMGTYILYTCIIIVIVENVYF